MCSWLSWARLWPNPVEIYYTIWSKCAPERPGHVCGQILLKFSTQFDPNVILSVLGTHFAVPASRHIKNWYAQRFCTLHLGVMGTPVNARFTKYWLVVGIIATYRYCVYCFFATAHAFRPLAPDFGQNTVKPMEKRYFCPRIWAHFGASFGARRGLRKGPQNGVQNGLQEAF